MKSAFFQKYDSCYDIDHTGYGYSKIHYFGQNKISQVIMDDCCHLDYSLMQEAEQLASGAEIHAIKNKLSVYEMLYHLLNEKYSEKYHKKFKKIEKDLRIFVYNKKNQLLNWYKKIQ